MGRSPKLSELRGRMIRVSHPAYPRRFLSPRAPLPSSRELVKVPQRWNRLSGTEIRHGVLVGIVQYSFLAAGIPVAVARQHVTGSPPSC